MSIININVSAFGDIAAALQGAQAGDTLNLYIQNDIIFTGAAMLTKSIFLNLINGSGAENVTLALSGGGTFRHFSTPSAGNLTGLTITVGPGIIFDGDGTGAAFSCTDRAVRCRLAGAR